MTGRMKGKKEWKIEIYEKKMKEPKKSCIKI